MAELSLDQIVPSSILPDDHWHHVTYDNTCSRCRNPIGEDDPVPLLIWSGNGVDMLAYCATCMGWNHD